MSMPETAGNTHTFFMPREEQLFFKHFHVIAGALVLAAFFLRVFVSGTSAEDTLVFALCLVLSLYLFRRIYAKRFADSVTLDFNHQMVIFSFSDERGAVKRNFKDIKKIHFRFYLTFVTDDFRVMVKRPPNKKEVFQLLQKVCRIELGLFAGF